MSAGTSMELPPNAGPLVATESTIHRFSVDQYHQMIDAGILTRADRVELIDGYIVAMTPIKPIHTYIVRKLEKALTALLPDWEVRVQQPLTLSTSEPEPDIVVARGDVETFRTRHPKPADAALVVEVADTSAAFDSGSKLVSYAQNGISEYWIVKIPNRTVEVHRNPVRSDGGKIAHYASRDVCDARSSLDVRFEGKLFGTISVAEILS